MSVTLQKCLSVDLHLLNSGHEVYFVHRVVPGGFSSVGTDFRDQRSTKGRSN